MLPMFHDIHNYYLVLKLVTTDTVTLGVEFEAILAYLYIRILKLLIYTFDQYTVLYIAIYL